MASNCTSCSITQDRSAYWTPALYFEHDDNVTYTLVPQVGGMTVYYFNNQGPAGQNVTAFPKGFSMISGDTRQRNFTLPIPDPPKSFWGPEDTTQAALAQKAIGFNCLSHSPGFVTEGALEYHYIRNKTFTDEECRDGLRLEVMFPSCWNGKDVTSDDHKSHIQFPELVENGACPDGFPVRMPVLFYETIFDIAQFSDYSGRFMLANGDFTGYGYHGDFIAGWNDTFLQQALGKYLFLQSMYSTGVPQCSRSSLSPAISIILATTVQMYADMEEQTSATARRVSRRTVPCLVCKTTALLRRAP